MKQPRAHIRVDFPEGCSVGPGKIALLEAIERIGSLSSAAREIGFSYRRAWLLLHSVNDSFVEPAVELSTGGKDGGGTKLTPFGRSLIKAYRQFENAVDALAARQFAGMKPRVEARPAVAARRRPVRRPLPARSRSQD